MKIIGTRWAVRQRGTDGFLTTTTVIRATGMEARRIDLFDSEEEAKVTATLWAEEGLRSGEDLIYPKDLEVVEISLVLA